MSLVLTIKSNMNVKYPIKHLANPFEWKNIYMLNVRVNLGNRIDKFSFSIRSTFD